MIAAPSNISIDICLCTWRRKHVAETLRSLSALTLKPEWSIRVIVADNDDTPSAQSLVEATAYSCRLPVTYIHAPARNISIARNACLEQAVAPFIAFLDDDEVATPGWLQALIATMEKDQADVVLGPVQALYNASASDWMRNGDFHSTRPVWVGSTIRTGYTCNVLFRRTSPSIKDRRFDLSLGRSGGEDTAFFAEITRAGGHISFAADAVITEEVPFERTKLSWLLKRRFRSGQTHGLLLIKRNGTLFARFLNALMASAKAIVCFLIAILSIMRTGRMYHWFLRGIMHIGVVCRLLGKREAELYG